MPAFTSSKAFRVVALDNLTKESLLRVVPISVINKVMFELEYNMLQILEMKRIVEDGSNFEKVLKFRHGCDRIKAKLFSVNYR